MATQYSPINSLTLGATRCTPSPSVNGRRPIATNPQSVSINCVAPPVVGSTLNCTPVGEVVVAVIIQPSLSVMPC